MRYVSGLRGSALAGAEMERGMAHDGKTQREASERPPGGARERIEPAMPSLGTGPASAPAPTPSPVRGLAPLNPGTREPATAGNEAPGPDRTPRRPAKRRPAGPARAKIAANDDAPSIGGLIFSLQQKPSNRPFQVAAGASAGWLAVGVILAWAMLASGGPGFSGPMLVGALATVLLPIALFWFLAMLVWRAQELKLMSSAMTEVAVRLAEPDRAAEQSAASLGQAVRRQVSFMNEAISRALGRAGELEALVHNEVAALEKSYGENEHKIKGLIQELVGERHALVSTTHKVSETLKSIGSEVPSQTDRQGSGNSEIDGRRGSLADRDAAPPADQTRQDHRGRWAEPDRAREQACDRQRRPGERARQSHPAAASRARRLYRGARRDAR